MVSRNAKAALSATLFTGVVLFAQAASAEDAAAAQARVDVTQMAAKAQGLFEKGASAEAFVNAVYDDNVVMMGGTPGAKKGKAAVLVEVKKWFDYMGPGGIKGCKYTMEQPAVVSATTYASFFNLHCEANPPYVKEAGDYSEMYIWKKTPQGWRIALEMWLEGAF
jgi:ketosteroid isomerase-like protein